MPKLIVPICAWACYVWAGTFFLFGFQLGPFVGVWRYLIFLVLGAAFFRKVIFATGMAFAEARNSKSMWWDMAQAAKILSLASDEVPQRDMQFVWSMASKAVFYLGAEASLFFCLVARSS